MPTYIPALGEIVIYTDRNTIGNVVYQGIKIGDGLAYVVDLPFVGDDVYQMILNRIEDHVNNTNIHVTQDEKNRWNNKLNYSINNEELIFNTQQDKDNKSNWTTYIIKAFSFAKYEDKQ